jgi:GTP-binding protein
MNRPILLSFSAKIEIYKSIMKSRLTVAIIGRANVGKSTLFNRLTDQSTALISPVAGTTRDRLEATCAWQGMEFTVIDSGGFDIDKRDEIDQKVLEQTDRAIENAKLILFVVDTNTGILPADKNFIAQLKKKKKKILLVANKADTLKKRQLINEFYQLGLGEPLPVSASNGSGTAISWINRFHA